MLPRTANVKKYYFKYYQTKIKEGKQNDKYRRTLLE